MYDRSVPRSRYEGLGSSSNQVGAFGAAFDVMEGAASGTQSSGCRKSIVLLSDNTGSIGYTPETDVPGAIAARNTARGNGDHGAENAEPVVVFSYSMGAPATSDGGVGKTIACQTGGIWAAVPSSTNDALKASLSGFYSYFSAAVATAATHTVWSEPYTYSGSGFLGTTVSSPVFDRTDPDNPIFLGVVAMDLLISSMEVIVGGDTNAARATVMRMLAERAAASCPVLTATECDLQSMRRASGGSNAMCPVRHFLHFILKFPLIYTTKNGLYITKCIKLIGRMRGDCGVLGRFELPQPFTVPSGGQRSCSWRRPAPAGPGRREGHLAQQSDDFAAGACKLRPGPVCLLICGCRMLLHRTRTTSYVRCVALGPSSIGLFARAQRPDALVVFNRR